MRTLDDILAIAPTGMPGQIRRAHRPGAPSCADIGVRITSTMESAVSD